MAFEIPISSYKEAEQASRRRFRYGKIISQVVETAFLKPFLLSLKTLLARIFDLSLCEGFIIPGLLCILEGR